MVCKREMRLVNLASLASNLIDSMSNSFLNSLFSTDLNSSVALESPNHYIFTLNRVGSWNVLKSLMNCVSSP